MFDFGGLFKMLKRFILAILAGIAISIGAICYLLSSNKIVGSALFAVGILMVMEFKLNLFTGFCPTQRAVLPFKEYIIDGAFIFVGNLLGAIITALLMALTKFKTPLYEAALTVCNNKMSGNNYALVLLSAFILAVFCAIIIAAIVKADNYKKQVVYVLMMIMTFILCGFEHVVANSFYFAMSLKLFTWQGLIFIIVCLLGNFLGGYLFSFITSSANKETAEKSANSMKD